MPEAVIVSTARSPIGRAIKGSLVDMRPDDLAAQMVRAALDKVPALDPSDIDDLIMGCGQPGGEAGLQHRRASSPSSSATTSCPAPRSTGTARRRCRPPGWRSTRSRPARATRSSPRAWRRCRASCKGNADGWPDTKNPLFDDAQARAPRRPPGGAEEWHDPREDGLLPDVYIAMGQTAENVALLHRHQPRGPGPLGRASARTAPRTPSRAASSSARSRRSRCPTAPSSATDDGPRAGTTYEKISQLKPVFRPNGTVTAGNACPLNDGAAALVIMSDTKAKDLGLTPLARIVSTGVSGLSPEIMGLGPIEAIKKALRQAGHDDLRHRPLRDQRGVRGAGARARRASWASTRTSSTSPAARSRWVIRSA